MEGLRVALERGRRGAEGAQHGPARPAFACGVKVEKTHGPRQTRPVVKSSLMDFTSCIVKSFMSRRSFMSSLLSAPDVSRPPNTHVGI